VKMVACGFCHTDLHVVGGDWVGKEAHLPVCAGHEGVGTIASLGPGTVIK
jgi:D-arabinose 1-dehydrogenase-like Zn-dependent alcohol dehydrogenase